MRKKLSGCGCVGRLDRRAMLAGIACVAIPRLSLAKAASSARRPEDVDFMRLALEEAKKGDFPFGAVIVREGKVAARGRNLGIQTNDPTAHGEMVAIRQFVSLHAAAELKGATIYTTGEPCPMCMSAILWCGFGRMVYAASIKELSARIGQIMMTSKSVAEAAPFQRIEITGGVLAREALALFK